MCKPENLQQSTNLLSHNVRGLFFFLLGFSLLKFSLVYTADKVSAPGEKLSGSESFGDGKIGPSWPKVLDRNPLSLLSTCFKFIHRMMRLSVPRCRCGPLAQRERKLFMLTLLLSLRTSNEAPSSWLHKV